MAQERATGSVSEPGNRPPGVGGHPIPGRGQSVGLLQKVRTVSSSVAIQRNVLESAWSASRQSTNDAARQVAELDRSMARAAANQSILRAKRETLDSAARRKLRTGIWQSLRQDRDALENHDGSSRLSLGWVVSLTADARRRWVADIWLPLGVDMPGAGLPLELWGAAVDACTEVSGKLQGGGRSPAVITAEAVRGIRVEHEAGGALDELRGALVHAFDRARVRAVALHQGRVEVSIIWLDIAVQLDGDPVAIEGDDLEDADTLVGKAVAE